MLYKIKPKHLLVRTEFCGKEREFFSSGERDSYNSSLRLLDEYYIKNRLIYKWNSSGYRTLEFSEFKTNEFGIAFGCSYTEGVGLHEHDIWHSHITNEFNIPMMNLGLGGAGHEVLRWNSILYASNIDKLPKPKFVVCQWPGMYRKAFSLPYDSTNSRILTVVPAVGLEGETEIPEAGDYPTRLDHEHYKNRYVVYPDALIKEVLQSMLTVDTIWKTLGVKVLHWMWWDDYVATNEKDPKNDLIHNFKSTIPIKFVSTNHIDDKKARDLMHPGRDVHKELFRQLTPGLTEVIK